MSALPFVHLAVAVLIAALAIPLVREKIAMNRWYGVRIPASFRSDGNWYRINRFGGRIMLWWAGLIAVVAGAGIVAGPRWAAVYPWVSLVVVFGGALALAGLVTGYGKRLVTP